MKKYEKEVLQEQLNNEKKVLASLKKHYQEALNSINEKIKLLQADELTQSKIYQINYQKVLQSQISTYLDLLQDKEYDSIEEYLKESYNNGYMGSLYSIQQQGIPLILPMDQEQIIKAIQLDSKISEGLYSKLGYNIKDLKTKIRAEVSRGIASGLMYGEIARNISNVANMDMNKSMRIARTEGHRIQCQAAQDACEKAVDKGADVFKQWCCILDGRTRDNHRMLDGEIVEVDKKFSNGLKFPGDSKGKAEEVINCRCTLLQSSRWELDEEELEELKERAKELGVYDEKEKNGTFEEYKKKFLEASDKVAEEVVEEAVEKVVEKPKKEYLTKKKLQANIANADVEIEELEQEFKNATGGWTYDDVVKDFGSLEDFADGDDLQKLKDIKKKADDLGQQKTEWQEKLDKKLVQEETKKLKKEQLALTDQVDNFQQKTYSGIWKDDVSTADWASKKGSIQAKKDYFENKLKMATDATEKQKWESLLKDLDDFNTQGEEYYNLTQALKQNKAKLTNIQKNGIISHQIDDKFSQERKDAALWFTDKNGSVKGADAVLRPVSGEVWKNATKAEQDAIYEYTRSYNKFNEPLRGIEYGTNKYLGVGNVDLNNIGVSYSGLKPGEVKKQIDAMTSIIEKSTYTEDMWLQRGCRLSGMDKFFGIDISDFNLPEAELANKLIGKTPTEYAFMSTGVAKGKGLNTSGGILLNIYAPSGTKMMYAEPFSAFGNGSGRKWDGVSTQSSFGNEAEMIIQRGTRFKVTKVEKKNGTIYIDMEVVEQEVY